MCFAFIKPFLTFALLLFRMHIDIWNLTWMCIHAAAVASYLYFSVCVYFVLFQYVLAEMFWVAFLFDRSHSRLCSYERFNKSETIFVQANKSAEAVGEVNACLAF